MIIPWVVWDLRSLERQTSRWQLLTPHLGNHQPSLKHTRNHNNLKKIVLNFGLPERKIMDLDRRSLCIRQSVRMPNVTTICTWKFGGCRNFRNCEPSSRRVYPSGNLRNVSEVHRSWTRTLSFIAFQSHDRWLNIARHDNAQILPHSTQFHKLCDASSFVWMNLCT